MERGTFEFVATKQIEVDEEVLVWYGDIGYWQDGRTKIDVV
jgi:hypothetical protein